MALGTQRTQGATAATVTSPTMTSPLQPVPLKGLSIDFPDEFSEFQARASTGGTVFGLLRRASGTPAAMSAFLDSTAADDFRDCNFLMVTETPKRGRSRSLGCTAGDLIQPAGGSSVNYNSSTATPTTTTIMSPSMVLSGSSDSSSHQGPPRTPGDGAENDSDIEQDNLLLCAYQGQPRRFSAACGDARDITQKHNIKVSISPAPSSKSFSSTSRLGDDRHDDVDDDHDEWGLPVYRDCPPYRRTSEADIDRLRPPEWLGATPEPEPTTYRRRSFSITPRGGIVNEGDFLVAKFGNTVVPASSVGSDLDQQGGSRSRASSFNSQQGSPALSAASSCDSPTYKVLVLGATGVGKTALTQQFMTSEYMGAQNTSFERNAQGAHYRTSHNGVECTVPVCIDGEDSFLEFTDLPDPENSEQWQQNGIDAFIVVYSVTDRASFQKAIDLLYTIRNTDGSSDMAVILVANKTDLMRARVIAEQEGKSTAATYDIKYIEVSAALNHKVDDLLVGVVKQIRLNPERTKRRRKRKKPLKKRDSEENTTGCLRKARENVLLKILNRSVGKMSKSCENLMTL